MQPMPVLEAEYGVERVDDAWFQQVERERETEAVVQAIRAAYERKRGFVKPRASALHDAKLLRWVDAERVNSEHKVWLVTFDTLLPPISAQHFASVRPFAITLDALLQWLSPVVSYEGTEDEIAAIFAEAVKQQLLPQDSFFDLRDFLVFAEMEMSCKELPAEDVEACIQYVRTNARTLDPSNPEDQKKLAHEIAKFFADPGRKYKQEVVRLESTIQQNQATYAEQLKEREAQAAAERAAREQEYAAQLSKVEAEREREVQAKEARIAELEEAERTRIAQEKRRQLRRSAIIRLLVIAVVLVGYEAGVVLAALTYGAGASWVDQLVGVSVYLLAGFPAALFILWFWVGPERLQALGGPFTRLQPKG